MFQCRLFLFNCGKLFGGCLDAPAPFVHIVFNTLRAEVSPSNFLGHVLDETNFGSTIPICQLAASRCQRGKIFCTWMEGSRVEDKALMFNCRVNPGSVGWLGILRPPLDLCFVIQARS